MPESLVLYIMISSPMLSIQEFALPALISLISIAVGFISNVNGSTLVTLQVKKAVADPEGVQDSNPLPTPIFNYPMKMK